MKNLRVSKKNPSKILKIIEAPLTHRYSHNEEVPTNFHIQHLALTSSKQKPIKNINISTHRQQINASPSRSHRFMGFSSLEKANKVKSRSLNRSEQMIKSQEKGNSKLVTKQSIEMKGKNEYSPYLKRNKFRQSDRYLNFNSVNLGEKSRKDSKEIFRNSSRRKHSFLKAQNHQIDMEKKAQQDIIQSAKLLLNNGEYRKSLLVVKSILKSKPEHIEALYLSGVNWYHLEDKAKAHYFIEQVLKINSAYSAECYKIKAVCYFKTFDYTKSLASLNQCHELFPDEWQSYQLQAKIYVRMKKWRQAIECYQKVYQFTSNVDMLASVGSCYQQLNQLHQALDYYQQVLTQQPFAMKTALKKMKLHVKMGQFQQVTKIMEQIEYQENILQQSREKDEIYYLSAYSFYKLKKYSSALIAIDEGMRFSQHSYSKIKFNRLLLMIKIMERDIYEAFHLIERLDDDEPELRVLKRFVEGIISLMRRNYNQGIIILLSIQQDLGFKLNLPSRSSSLSSVSDGSPSSSFQISDQFLNELKKIYLLFLSYGYITISQFDQAYLLMELQKEIQIPPYFQLGYSYNRQICLGIIQHCNHKFREAQSHFVKAKAIYQNKLQPSFSLAINYMQLMVNAQSEVVRQEMIQEAKGQFDCGKKILGKIQNNTAASLYYFNSLLHGYLQEWKEALVCIDQSIDRSEDHYWRYFYIRGMLMASIHNFKEAINDLSVAINLSGITKPECYLLRSKCLQIEGEGNEAFKDLQEYISLRPDDPEVHKYAGQLLFQNGAFEDSLSALSHQSIPLTSQNYDIFLTESKNLFLLGRFSEAISSIRKAHSLQPNEQIYFDIRVFQFLENLTIKKDPLIARALLQEIYGDLSQVGRIFKISDFYLLRGYCLVGEKKYNEAVQAFSITVKERINELKEVDEEDEIAILENRREVDTFTNQMRYNKVLCYLNMGDLESAKSIVQQMNIQLDQPYYSDFVNFKKFVLGDSDNFKKEEVFPSRNKLSNFLEKIKVSRNGKNLLQLKMCIPFPKVEPPEIFPSFDKNLVVRLSVLNVERKPEAPWILRETNSIKFTDKIEVYSRLQLDDSEFQSSSTYQMISVDHSHIDKHSNRSKRLRTDSEHLEGKRLTPKLVH